MNDRAQRAANKILMAFEDGGILPLEHSQPEKYAQITRHVFSILARAMESKREKGKRKWETWQRVKAEASGESNASL